MNAWRVLDKTRKLRRPPATLDPATSLDADLVSGVSLEGVDLSSSRQERLTLVDSVLRRCELTAAVWQQLTVRQTELLDCRALGLRLSVDLAQDLYVSDSLKTGRVMVKDEDVCLHCGLCAERCPTGAWDMQKFLLDMTHAAGGPACRRA